MNETELQAWVVEHADDISAFTDYEPAAGTEEALHRDLETTWFRDPDWNERGYRFLPLGLTGTGGIVAAWRKPGYAQPAPVVFFGSEGGYGILTSEPSAFAQALGHAPLIQEWDKSGGEELARLSLDDNWFFRTEEPELALAATLAIDRYRSALFQHFSPVRSFESLTNIPTALQAEFHDWVAGIQRRVTERAGREEAEATEQKRQALRAKAANYARQSARGLPAGAAALTDGAQYSGWCPVCRSPKRLRLTRFEDSLFGICFSCYFSKAW